MTYQIPFNKDGLVNWVGHWMKDIIWKDNYIFSDTLYYVKYYTGKSSVTFEFKDSNGLRYTMSLMQFDALIKDKLFKNNSITADWTFVKRGQNYLIERVKDSVYII
jgi:hypothetical protein